MLRKSMYKEKKKKSSTIGPFLFFYPSSASWFDLLPYRLSKIFRAKRTYYIIYVNSEYNLPNYLFISK